MSGRKSSVKWAGAIALFGLSVSGATWSASIQHPTISPAGALVAGYQEKNDSTLEYVPVSTANIQPLLIGNASDPGGNIELGKYGYSSLSQNPGVVSLTGEINGNSITLSSLVLADWESGLADSYIRDAAASVNVSLTDIQFGAIKANFFNMDIAMPWLNSKTNVKPWQLLSDPNIAYVNSSGGTVSIGLQGLLDASELFWNLFKIPNATNPRIPLQASEVVKVTYGGRTSYLYGFSANDSGQSWNGAFTGNYEVTVPEPKTWLLMLSALFALTGAQILRSRSA